MYCFGPSLQIILRMTCRVERPMTDLTGDAAQPNGGIYFRASGDLVAHLADAYDYGGDW